jgi:hypothetical protein
MGLRKDLAQNRQGITFLLILGHSDLRGVASTIRSNAIPCLMFAEFMDKN